MKSYKEGDTISRQAAIDAINTWDKFGVDERSRMVRWYEGLEPYVHLRDVVTAIVNLPPAQPERKKGRWIYGEYDGQDGWYCSECGGFVPWDYDYYGLDNIDFIKDFKTCPRCDARMISYTGMEEGEQDG